MKVTFAEDTTIQYVTFEGADYNEYRRLSPISWEVLMGNSWVTVYDEEEELEAAYQKYKKQNTSEPRVVYGYP